MAPLGGGNLLMPVALQNDNTLAKVSGQISLRLVKYALLGGRYD